MKKLPPETIKRMRQAKLDGESLKNIAAIFGCSRSTASLHCRDTFNHPRRKYKTEAEAREAIARHYRTHPCIDCGKQIRVEHIRCAKCHLIKIKEAQSLRIATLVACKASQRASQTREAFTITPSERNPEYALRLPKTALPPIELAPCSLSPAGAHYWKLDSKSYGICKYCGEERQFQRSMYWRRNEATSTKNR